MRHSHYCSQDCCFSTPAAVTRQEDSAPSHAAHVANTASQQSVNSAVSILMPKAPLPSAPLPNPILVVTFLSCALLIIVWYWRLLSMGSHPRTCALPGACEARAHSWRHCPLALHSAGVCKLAIQWRGHHPGCTPAVQARVPSGACRRQPAHSVGPEGWHLWPNRCSHCSDPLMVLEADAVGMCIYVHRPACGAVSIDK